MQRKGKFVSGVLFSDKCIHLLLFGFVWFGLLFNLLVNVLVEVEIFLQRLIRRKLTPSVFRLTSSGKWNEVPKWSGVKVS